MGDDDLDLLHVGHCRRDLAAPAQPWLV